MTADMRTQTVSIDRLGHLGDGIATTDRGPVFVPMTLPGERVEVQYDTADKARARATRILEESPERVAPICRHFGTCGGCALQHMAGPAYLDWKREQVRAALGHRGLDAPVAPTVAIGPGSRRRAVFAARRDRGGNPFGYHAKQSHRIVEISECPILVPEIERALPGLSELIGPLVPPKGEVRIAVTATLTGLDVAVDGKKLRIPPTAATSVQSVQALGIARLSVAGETVLQMIEPVITVDDTEVAVPPRAFLQAALAAEEAMARLVEEGVGKSGKVADLYAGTGTFALRLARRVRVLAVEGDQSALDALSLAAKRARGVKPVTTLKRDLARMPVSAGELSGYDAAVFDPPRAGAAAQAAELAGPGLPRIVAVSCNPATLSRDLRILVDGGYRIDKVTPVDQFLYSPHIEAVAQLSRER